MASTATSTEQRVKLVLAGDSAVGKSKMTERFLHDSYNSVTTSTQGVVIHKYTTTTNGKTATIEFWDTAGQPTWQEMHPSFFDGAYAAILVFDITRKDTYTHLTNWYTEMQQMRKGLPCVLVANKIDVDPNVTSKSFNFATKHNMPMFFVSAKDGTNAFQKAVDIAVKTKENPPEEWMDDLLDLI